MNRLIHLSFILSLFISPANALELGPIKLESHLNEPLRASFTLKNIDINSLGDIILSLADQDTYHSMGLIRPYFLSKLTFKITAGQNASHIVHIATRQRIKEPILDILVKVTEAQSSLTRLYTMILDPVEMVEATTNEASVLINKPQENEIEKGISSQQDKPSPRLIQVENDSISIIAQNSSLHKKYSVYQIMRAFYLINTSEFLHGNINSLKSGSSLIVPAEKMVAEVSRQKSINFVYAVSKNNPLNNKYVNQKKEIKAVPDPKVITDQIITKKAENIQLTDNSINQNKSEQPLSLSMQEDVKSWRTVSDEFKSLSSIVQNQNKALKIQSSVLQSINDQLEQKNQQIELVNVRLQALENSQLPSATDHQVLLPENQDTSINPNNEILQQEAFLNNINETLSKRLNEINRIKARLDELESLESKLTDNPPPPAAPKLPVMNLEPETEVIFENPKSAYLKWGLLVLALLFILIRERVWRGRLKSKSASLLPEVNSLDMESTEEDKPVEKQIIEEDQQVENIKPVVQQVPEQSNIKIADQKFQEAVTQAREFKGNPVIDHHTSADEQIKTETLYSEIDILIAYQMYDEAFELIEAARETLDDNECLNIRELEVLAYTKNIDIFFPKYDQMKLRLAEQFPQAWEKIETLHKQLTSEFQMTATL